MLNDLKIDKHSQIPLHQQLMRSLREAILSGKLINGTKLPTEEELHVAFGLSRPVIRQAYKQLLDEHLIYRQKGKGSFVRHKEFHYGLLASTMPLNEKIRRSGLQPSTIELERKVIDYDGLGRTDLPCPKGSKVLMIKRLYKGDDQILFYMETYRPLDLFPELEHFDTKLISITEYIKDHYGYSIEYAKRSIYAVVLDDELCAHFELANGSPGFKLDTTSYAHDGQVIEFSIAYIQGQNVSVSFDF